MDWRRDRRANDSHWAETTERIDQGGTGHRTSRLDHSPPVSFPFPSTASEFLQNQKKNLAVWILSLMSLIAGIFSWDKPC